MPLNSKFEKFSTETPVQAVFDYSDFENGVGFVTYYLVAYDTSVDGTGAPVVNTDLNPFLIEGENSGIGSADLDLSPFQVTKTIEGDAWFEGFLHSGAGAFGIIIKRVRGVTETDLNTEVFTAVETSADDELTVKIVLAKTVFKKGDFLRITTRAIGSGPKFKSTKANPAKIFIPFEINL